MSFYDSASLVFLPSGGAGKDGKAYSIKPVPEYGNELVTNGGFDTDSDWTKTNATISGGVATITSTGYAYAAVVQNNVLTIGKTYKATIDVNSIVGGLRVATSQVITNSGIASVTFTATNTYLDIRRDSSFATTTAVIDNVSVKEVIVDGDFTFSRGSNLTATRVNSSGLIEKGRENLLKDSNSFNPSNTAWNPTSAYTIQSGQLGYDGSTDAWLLNKLNTLNDYFQQRSIIGMSGSVVTESIYAKAGTEVGLILFNNNGYAYWNLSSGTSISEGGNLISSNIESIGNGWYRCSLTVPGNVSYDRMMIKVVNSYGNDTSGSIYIQDSQLEIGLVATEYIESGASSGKAGILEHSPRFDYGGGASCPSLLLEPSRTNLIGYSEYFGDSSWTKSAATITNNALTSPQGNNNASYLTDDTANNFHGLRTIKNISSIVTCSIFVKYDNKQFVSFLTNNNGASDRYAYFDLINKTTHTISSGLTASIEDVSGGWLRLSVTSTSSANGYYWWNIAASNSTTAYVGDGTGRVGIFGAQLEQGSYPTSYIPNHSGGSVTREADSMQSDTSSFNITNEFTLFIDTNGALVDGTSLNQMDDLRWYTQSTNRYRFYKSSNAIFISNNIQVDDRTKIALKITATECKTFVDGVLDSTISLTTPFASFDSISRDMETKVKEELNQILLFPTALSDTDLEILTGTSYESFAAMATALNYTTYE